MNNNGIIHSPVGIDSDIAPVLGETSADLGYLCSNLHGKTNKWSRFKPLVHTIYNDVDLHMWYDFKTGDSSKFWNGGDGKCGLYIPYTTTITSAVDRYLDGYMMWGYNAPEPNSVQPARALDFDGYNHNAVPPVDFSNIETDRWLENAGSDHKFTFGFDSVISGTPQENPYNLTLDDISFGLENASGDNQQLKNWYLGLLMQSKSRLHTVAITNDKPFSEGGGLNIEILGNSTWLAGEWDIIPFMCPQYVNTLTNGEIDSTYISIDVPSIRITIHSINTLVYGLTSAYWLDDVDKTLGYTGRITNDMSSDQTCSVKLHVCSTEKGYTPVTDPNGSWHETELDLGTFNLLADGGYVDFLSENEGGDYPTITLNQVLDDRMYWVGMEINENGVPNELWQPVEESIKLRRL